MKKFLKKDNLLWLGIVFFILVIVHFPLLTKNIIGADILLNNYYYEGYSWELSLGRFGLLLVGFIKGFLSVPYMDLFISFLLIGMSILLIIDLFEIKKNITKILCIILFSLSPIVSATLLFHYCAIGYFLAFFTGIFSIYIFYKAKNKYLKYMVSLLAIIVSLSMYQAYFSLIITFFVIYNLYLILNNKINYKEAFKYLLIFILGVILYFIMMKLTLVIFNINMANYSNANKIGIDTIFKFPSKFVESYILFYKFFFTDKIVKNTYLYNHIINLLLLIILLVNLTLIVYKNKVSIPNIIMGILIIVLLPVFLNSVIFVINDAKLQLLMSTSYLFIFLLMIILNEYEFKIKYLTLFLLIILFRNYLIQDQASYMSLENSFNKYKTIIDSSILKNVNNLDKKFVIIGKINDKKDNSLAKIYDLNYGYICDDNIFWDEYNLRKLAFLRFVYEYYGLEINFALEDEYNYILDNRNTDDILYSINDINVIDFYNY